MALKPKAEANKLSSILNSVLKDDRFPVDVESLALEYSQAAVPEEPIKKIKHDSYDNFDGALLKNAEKSQWMILCNDSIRSEGRKRFTVAHELGHYMLHRLEMEQFLCSSIEGEKTTSSRNIENEADTFASYLLMPFDDCRKQITDQSFSIELLMHCANRYGVSLMAAALKIKEILPKRVVVIAARDGIILWAAPNDKAFKSKAYIKTKGLPPVFIPEGSLMEATSIGPSGGRKKQPANLWFPGEPSDIHLIEHVFVATEGYDYTLGVLELENYDFPSGKYEEDQLIAPLNGKLFIDK